MNGDTSGTQNKLQMSTVTKILQAHLIRFHKQQISDCRFSFFTQENFI